MYQKISEKKPKSQTWTTTDEKQFIDGLGTHVLSAGDSSISPKDVDLAVRAELLIKYAKSMKKRVNWGCIDKDEISHYVKKRVDALNTQIRQVTAKALKQINSPVN